MRRTDVSLLKFSHTKARPLSLNWFRKRFRGDQGTQLASEIVGVARTEQEPRFSILHQFGIPANPRSHCGTAAGHRFE